MVDLIDISNPIIVIINGKSRSIKLAGTKLTQTQIKGQRVGLIQKWRLKKVLSDIK
jgi:hypothetical protein